MNKILLDTNVLIYALDNKSQFHSACQNLLLSTEILCFTTSKNLSEYLAVVTRLPKNPLPIETAVKAMIALLENVTLLHSTQSSMAIFRDLLLKHRPTGLKIHDYEIAGIALSQGITTIATYNERDFKDISEIRVFVPSPSDL
jgi:predicted nucleic acid-binding protein